ncbi:hypothetical protein SD77_1473 [Bacillus badius]|uniref:Uncharacterized protein n=1 Tax=Bacillus badius TaxID=1455 RepID=A0ABR5ARX2_BACBA|nr:hypothetical protein SD78_3131 [Bacillus badius]KIL77487.1 hypothetical protein SD77_1473 [Bacillus badius]
MDSTFRAEARSVSLSTVCIDYTEQTSPFSYTNLKNFLSETICQLTAALVSE